MKHTSRASVGRARCPWAAAAAAALLLLHFTVYAQQPAQAGPAPAAPPAPAVEFRGLWVATVANIDWPSRPGLPVSTLRSEMQRIIDAAAACNLNALLLQVRPACDAMYPSTLEPWSEFLTGRSGRPPRADDGGDATDYDPLAEWIAAAHARGLELHAWINPFRARHIKAAGPDAASHISSTRPDLIRAYDGYAWLDPGEADARNHTLAVVKDLVQRYDLDGVHMDDYFYPYPKKGVEFDDRAGFERARARGEATDRAEWRRANIDVFVPMLWTAVKQTKPGVRVGISPFGIWRPGHPPQVKGFDAYDGLYADARRWLRDGLVDYLAPQLYWKLEAKEQPFVPLLSWWLDQRALDDAVPVWPGLYATRINGTPESWQPQEILDQIAATRAATLASGPPSTPPGFVLYSAIGVVENRQGLADALRAGPCATPARVPALPPPFEGYRIDRAQSVPATGR